jgi:flagellar motor switch/type III secretory pathway protein FliN
VIADLAFGAAAPVAGRRVRTAHFVPRSAVALSTACVVANGMRETLRALFGGAVAVEIGEVAAIDAHAWDALARDAELLVVSGNAADAALVIDPADARRLVLHAFGEDAARPTMPESALERRAYERLASALAGALDPLCGERLGPPRRAHPADARWTSYFDVRVRAPIEVRIGVAVARERAVPRPAVARPLSFVAEVPVVVTARMALAPMTLAGLARLRVGDVVRCDTEAGFSAALNIVDRCAAHGTCGVANGRLAVRISASALAKADAP